MVRGGENKNGWCKGREVEINLKFVCFIYIWES